MLVASVTVPPVCIYDFAQAHCAGGTCERLRRHLRTALAALADAQVRQCAWSKSTVFTGRYGTFLSLRQETLPFVAGCCLK